MSAPTKCQSKFDAAHPASLNYGLIDRHMIDSYFAVARQKGRDKDRRAALIWINLLETFQFSSTNGHVRPCNLKPQRRDLAPVLRRPVEPARAFWTQAGHRATCAMCQYRHRASQSKAFKAIPALPLLCHPEPKPRPFLYRVF